MSSRGSEAVRRDEPGEWAPPATAKGAANGARRIRTYEELDGAEGRAVFFRPHRFTAADLAPLEGIVSVGHGAEARECALRDVSQNGVAFEWPSGEKLRHGQPLRLSLRFDGHELWRGEARVSSVRERDGIVGASLGNTLLDTDELLHLRGICSWRVDGSPRAEEKCWVSPGHDRFKALVADFRLFLEDSAQKLGELEKALPWHAMQDPASLVRSAIVRHLRAGFVTDVLRFIFETDAALRGTDPSEDAALKEYSRRQIDHLVLQAPWMHRARFKPFGYPGDYEVMNFFYEKDFEGPTLFARAVGYACIQAPATRAVSYRKDLMKRQLRACLERHASSRPVRFLSIAAGPARELQELLAEIDELPAPLEIVLFEQDKGALAHAYRRLRPLTEARFPGRVQILFLNESIKRLLRDKHLFETFDGFDAIYSCGLFDYLQEMTAVRLARSLYSAAGPGGRVYIGNMVDHQVRWYMAHHLEWELNYRTREELVDIGHRAAPQAAIRVLEEETGINPFIELARD